MNAGQILVQIPVAATQPVAAQANSPAFPSQAGNQEKSVFAGVLCGVSPRDSARATISSGAGKSGHTDTETPTAAIEAALQPGTSTVALATVMAVLGTGMQVVPSVPTDARAEEEKLKTDSSAICPDVLKPQNVVLDAVQLQNGLAMQINGRMPEAELKVAVNCSESSSANRAETQPPPSVAAPLSTSVMQVPITLIHAGNSGEPAVVAPAKAFDGGIKTASQNVVAAKEQTLPGSRMVVSVLQGGTPAAESAAVRTASTATVSQNVPRSISENEVQGVISASTPATNLRNVVTSAQAATDVNILPKQVSTAFNSIPQTATTDSSKEAATLPSGLENAEARPSSGTESVQNVPIESTSKPAVSVTFAVPSELSDTAAAVVPADKTVPETSIRTNMEAYFQTSVRPVATTVAVSSTQAMQAAVPLPATDAPADVRSSVETGQRPVRGEIKLHNELMAAEDQPALRQGSAAGSAKTEVSAGNTMTGSIKEASSTTTGEDFGRSGSGFGDQKMGGQTNLAMMHQVSLDKALPAATTTAAANDPLRPVQADQIVSQVKDHLVGREIKSGVEQVVIRLSPENLGELKMNLRMENQRLKVEIVAETPMVRDTLMKHADTLKESLARQNITMESFDVSTGSNKQGTASQGQGDWRELARQRQYNSWAAGGGYKLGDVPEMPITPIYQASTAHSMLDVHF